METTGFQVTTELPSYKFFRLSSLPNREKVSYSETVWIVGGRMSEMEVLFNKYDVHAVREGLKKDVITEIDSIPEKNLLSSNIEQWVAHFNSKFRVEVPILKPEDATCDTEDQKVDARYLPDRFIFDRHGSTYVDGTKITYFIPFEGDKDYFYVHPSSWGSIYPRAYIDQADVCLIYQVGVGYNPDDIAKKYQEDLNRTQSFLSSVRSDMEQFNTSLEGLIRSRLGARISKLQADQQSASKLGVPLRKRSSAPANIASPLNRKKIVPKPTVTETRVAAEPEMLSEDYESVLSVLNHMTDVMERSPDGFKTLDEEALRTHFLVQLNGQFEGGGTGETFNVAGKTDILLKHQGKCIFIAECKVWKGASVIDEAIGQLLNYLSWRDTKVALLIFNRNKDLTNVLKQIPEICSRHPNYVKQWKAGSRETEFRYIFRHNDDKERQIYLTVQVYDLPT